MIQFVILKHLGEKIMSNYYNDFYRDNLLWKYDMLYPDNPELAEELAQKEFNQIEELGT